MFMKKKFSIKLDLTKLSESKLKTLFSFLDDLSNKDGYTVDKDKREISFDSSKEEDFAKMWDELNLLG